MASGYTEYGVINKLFGSGLLGSLVCIMAYIPTVPRFFYRVLGPSSSLYLLGVPSVVPNRHLMSQSAVRSLPSIPIYPLISYSP
jgi:hypothetical protein